MQSGGAANPTLQFVPARPLVLNPAIKMEEEAPMAHIGKHVKMNEPAFVHETAYIYGKVTLHKDVSVWPYVVMRAEMHEIVIGEKTNIQDFVMVHVGNTTPTIVGKNCSITHHVTIHGCTIGDNCLIGINATIMDGAIIGNNCIVAGHSIVTEGAVFPDNSIIAGAPAKVIRTRDSGAANAGNAEWYFQNALRYARGEDVQT